MLKPAALKAPSKPVLGEWNGELFAIEAHLRRIGAMLSPGADTPSPQMREELMELRQYIDDFLKRHGGTIPEETAAYFRTAVREIEAIRRRWMAAPAAQAKSA